MHTQYKDARREASEAMFLEDVAQKARTLKALANDVPTRDRPPIEGMLDIISAYAAAQP